MPSSIIDQMKLSDYLKDTISRCPRESVKILEALSNAPLNMDRISQLCEINRTLLKNFLAPLEMMGLVNLERYGMAKEYSLSKLGAAYIELLKNKGEC